MTAIPKVDATLPFPVNVVDIVETIVSSNKKIALLLDSSLPSDMADGQRLIEAEVLAKFSACPHDIVNSLYIRFFSLNPLTINNVNYDFNYYQGLECLVHGLISADMTFVKALKLRRWLTKATRIGEITQGGAAFTLSGDNADSLFVIKTPINGTLVHEAFLGLCLLNSLKRYVPNFMYTYGYFHCTKPLQVTSTKLALDYCRDLDDPTQYVILENLRDTTAFGDILPNLTSSEYLQIILQVMNALNVAYKQYKFTHYDLHLGNVLVQKLVTPVAIPITIAGITKYLITSYLAYIIDFGNSYAELTSAGGQTYKFGITGFEYVGIYDDRPYPAYDSYKLITSTAIVLFKTTGDLATTAQRLYALFGEGSVTKRYKTYRANKGRDFLQPSISYGGATHKKLSHEAVLQYIVKEFDLSTILLATSQNAILLPCTDNCMTWDAFNALLFNSTQKITSLEDYCDAKLAIAALENSELQQDYNNWLATIELEGIYYNDSLKLIALVEDGYKLATTIKDKFDEPTISIEELSDIITQSLVTIRDRLYSYNYWLYFVDCSNFSAYSTPELQDLYDQLRVAYSTLRYNYTDLVDNANAIVATIPDDTELVTVLNLLFELPDMSQL